MPSAALALLPVLLVGMALLTVLVPPPLPDNMVLRLELVKEESAAPPSDLVLVMVLPVLVFPQALLVSDLVTVLVPVLVPVPVLVVPVLAQSLGLEVPVLENTVELSLTKTEVVSLDIISSC